MKGQAQKEARYIKSALKIKRKVKSYGNTGIHNILCSSVYYRSTCSVRYLDKIMNSDLEEKSNNGYIPVQRFQGLQVGPPVERCLHTFQLSGWEDQHPPMKGQAQEEARYIESALSS